VEEGTSALIGTLSDGLGTRRIRFGGDLVRLDPTPTAAAQFVEAVVLAEQNHVVGLGRQLARDHKLIEHPCTPAPATSTGQFLRSDGAPTVDRPAAS